MKTGVPLRRFFSNFSSAYKGVLVVRALVWCALILVIILFTSIVLFGSKTEAFSFTQQQCVSGITVLPKAQKVRANIHASANYTKTVNIFNYPIISRQTCYSFKTAPQESAKIIFAHNLAGVSFLSRQDSFSIPEYPKLISKSLATISTTEPLTFSLSKPDSFFAYTLTVESSQANCSTKSATITCDTAALKLEHAKEYTFGVEQAYNKKRVKQVATLQAKTANPITINSSTITNKSTVYDKPQSITLVTDRPVIKLGTTKLISNMGRTNQKEVQITSRTEGQKIVVEWAEVLARNTTYTLQIDSALAADGGSFALPYTHIFTTSGGPRVKGINIQDRAVPLGQGFVISFDQTILPAQVFAQLVELKAGGTNVNVSYSVSGRTITLQPKTQLPFCAALSIKVSSEMQSSFGIKSGADWVYSSRTTCANVYSIGTSVKGRQIVAYKFGSGPKIVMFTGALHGDEGNSKRILDKWIYELQGNPGKIPAGKEVVVVPLLNPDGFAVGSRFNANGVDLNRNFPANNWKSSIKVQNGQTLPTGGGATALSEPESTSLSNAISSHNPSLVISYHSQGGIALANDVSGAWNFAKTYASKAGYIAKTNATIGSFFDYDTTGAFEDWLADKKGIPCVLVELSTKTSDEFGVNKSAMWQMVFNY